ncbi:MAG: glycosyl hydrolase family 28-related protein [Kiritimatiellia bacterium]
MRKRLHPENPITKHMFRSFIHMWCLYGAITSLSLLKAETIQYPSDPGVIDVTKAPYFADNTGATDVTAILQQAIYDHVDTRKIIYFPNGTYKVSDTLKWVNSSGNWKAFLMLQGQSRAGTIIRLADNTPSFGGSNPAKAVIMTGSRDNQNPPGGGNEAFMNTIRNMTLHTGSGNTQAIAVDYQVSNQGAIKNVTIKSGDGAGVCGIALTRGWPGPGLVKNVSIEGFDYGIKLGHADYSMTFEHLTLKNQNLYGIYCDANTIHVRKLTSTNTVPAIRMLVGGSHLTLLDSTLTTGGPASTSAAIMLQGIAYVRNTSVSGYATALDSENSNNRDVAMDGNPTMIDEYFAFDPNKAFSSTPSTALNLPVEETPTYVDGPISEWANAADYGAISGGSVDATVAIQNALNSGKATVYIPKGTYKITGTLTVPATVRHLLSANGVLSPEGSAFDNAASPTPLLRFTGSTTQPLIVEQIWTSSTYAVGLIIAEQATTRPLVFQHCALITRKGRYGYHNTVPGGKVFFEDVATMRIRLNGNQKLWARQLNPESINDAVINEYPHMENFGGTWWSLGVKIEGHATIMETRDGGTSEIMGGFWRMLANVSSRPMFKNDNSRMAVTYRTSYADFTTHVSETRGATTNTLLRSQVKTYGNGSNVTMYLGYE